MNKNEENALETLRSGGEVGMTVSTLSSYLNMSKSGTLGLMKRLKKDGLVGGEQQTKQKVWRFWITSKGESTLFDNDNDLQIELL